MTFKFDTSGKIERRDGQQFRLHDTYLFTVQWPDLSPFVQGYVEAMATTAPFLMVNEDRTLSPFGFSDLASETLTRIMEDCERRTIGWPPHVGDDEWRKLGRRFWEQRSTPNRYQEWVTLTPYLGDDGKVYLQEAGQCLG